MSIFEAARRRLAAAVETGDPDQIRVALEMQNEVERVPSPPIDTELEARMAEIDEATRERLARDLRLLSALPQSVIDAMPTDEPVQAPRARLTRADRRATDWAMSAAAEQAARAQRIANARAEAAGRGLGRLFDPDAPVLQGSTRDVTLPETDETREQYLERLLRDAHATLRARDTELTMIRRRVRDLFNGNYMPSPSVILTALHPYPEQVRDYNTTSE